jgi:ubiquinone/menaquinone biosynthesis C-methylase UbiE
MSIAKDFFSQTRKPEGFLGKVMLGTMNSGHAKLADWGFTHLPAMTPENAVDLGCGGGRNAGELLKMFPKAHVTGVDYSDLSVEKSKDYNKAMIEAGRCKVLQGDVSALPFRDGTFDLATAFETVYFWPGPVKSFSEVCRILKPGGRFLIVNESDGMDKTGKQFETIIDGMHTYTAEELEAALQAAGFAQVKTAHHPQKPWLAILATKGE